MKKTFELNDMNSKLDYIKFSAPSIYEKTLPELEKTGDASDFRNKIIIGKSVLEAFDLSGNPAIITTDIYDACAINKYLTKESTVHIDGKYKIVDDMCFIYSPALETVIFEEGVEYIKGRVLYCNATLKKVSLPKSLNYIGEGAFENCENLTNNLSPRISELPRFVQTVQKAPMVGYIKF